MSIQEVDDAVRFAIEDIEESVDLLEDAEYVLALQKIEEWCRNTWVARNTQVRNAGGRA